MFCIKALHQTSILQIFSPCLWSVFSFSVSFTEQKFVILIKSSLIFSFMNYAFGGTFKNSSSNPRSY